MILINPILEQSVITIGQKGFWNRQSKRVLEQAVKKGFGTGSQKGFWNRQSKRVLERLFL